MKPWEVRDFCVPREDVLRGEINDAIFAADFGDLVSDGAPVYRNPATFFANTHPARELKNIVNKVFRRLSDPTEAGPSTDSAQVWGRKTHTLARPYGILLKVSTTPTWGANCCRLICDRGKVTVIGIVRVRQEFRSSRNTEGSRSRTPVGRNVLAARWCGRLGQTWGGG